MPIQGKLYASNELQKLLKVSRQRISNLAREQGWEEHSQRPGLYWAQSVEPYLINRGIDPATLPIISWGHQDKIAHD